MNWIGLASDPRAIARALLPGSGRAGDQLLGIAPPCPHPGSPPQHPSRVTTNIGLDQGDPNHNRWNWCMPGCAASHILLTIPTRSGHDLASSEAQETLCFQCTRQKRSAMHDHGCREDRFRTRPVSYDVQHAQRDVCELGPGATRGACSMTFSVRPTLIMTGER